MELSLFAYKIKTAIPQKKNIIGPNPRATDESCVTLAARELEIVERLKKVIDNTGVFGEMMRLVFETNEPAVVRQLLADIKYQSYFAPDATARMIGLETFLLLVKL